MSLIAAIAFGKNRYPELDLRVGDATTVHEFEANSFDTILLIDVIEKRDRNADGKAHIEIRV